MQFEYDPERLIEEIKKRPGIWDLDDENYRNKVSRHNSWNEVVTELLQSDVKVSKSEMRELEIQLQKKWKSIRDCFQKYINNPNRTKKPYIYSKHLQFLLKNTIVQNDASTDSDEPVKPKRIWKTRRKILNLRKDSTDEDEDNVASDNNEDYRAYSNDEAEVEVPNKKVRKHNKTPADEFIFASVDTQSKLDSEDCDKMFLLSLLPHLKSIPEEYRINAKLDLMQVLRNANYGVPNNRDQKLF